MSLRVADIHLRGRPGPVRARIYRPVDAGPAPALLVFVGGADAVCRDLCSRAGLVVLAAPVDHLDEATAVVEWAADHAAELGADRGEVLLAGSELAVAVAERARDNGWPPVRLLTGPPLRD